MALATLVLPVSLTRSDVGEQIARRTADAYLDGNSYRYRLPEAYSLSRSYGYFTPPRPELDTVLYIGRDPAQLRGYFDTSREIADIGDDMRAYVLTGRRKSWESIWSRERTLTVS